MRIDRAQLDAEVFAAVTKLRAEFRWPPQLIVAEVAGYDVKLIRESINRMVAKGELKKESNSKWTPAVIIKLRMLYAQGLSAQRIAEKLGPEFTKNMVIGALRRRFTTLGGFVPRLGPPRSVWSVEQIALLKQLVALATDNQHGRLKRGTRAAIAQQLGFRLGTIKWKIDDLRAKGELQNERGRTTQDNTWRHDRQVYPNTEQDRGDQDSSHCTTQTIPRHERAA